MDGKHYGPAHPDSGTGRLDESGEGISYIYGGEGVIAQRIPNKETISHRINARQCEGQHGRDHCLIKNFTVVHYLTLLFVF